MANDVEMQLRGAKELARQLNTFKAKDARRLTRVSTKAGAYLVSRQYRRNIKRVLKRRNASNRIGGREGSLFDLKSTNPKIDKQFKRSRKQGAGYIVLPGARGGYGFWGRVLEMGDPGRGVPARPMLRPAYDTVKDKVGSTIINRFWAGITKLKRKG